MGVRLNDEDIVYVQQIHKAVSDAISGMPRELMKNGRFGAWVLTALTNLICSIFKMMNLDKEKAYQLIDDIWDNQDNIYNILN